MVRIVKNIFILLLAISSTLAFSQSQQRIVPALQNPVGGGNYAKLGPNASVYVCSYNTQLTCTSNYFNIYSDVNLTIPIVQPVLADSNGVYQYFIASGSQVVEKVCFNVSQCQSYGVYFSEGSGGSGSPAGPAYAVNFANSLVNAFQGNPNFTFNPITLTEDVPNLQVGSAVISLPTNTVLTGTSVTTQTLNAGSINILGAAMAGTTTTLAPLALAVDATSYINTALASYQSVTLGPGVYPITCDAPTNITASSGGIRPPTGSTLTMGANTILKCAANATGYYQAIALYNVSNVSITGGVLDGNRSNVTAPGSTQTGFGVECNGCANVTIRDTVAQNFWGDGFYVTNKSSTQPLNVILDHVYSNNSRRNGLSVESANGLIVSNSTFNNSNGTMPQFGVDVEPGGGSNTVVNAQFINNTYSNNLVAGFGAEGSTGTDITNLAVIGGTVTGNGSANLSSCGSGALYLYNISNPILVEGTTVSGNYCVGVFSNVTTDTSLRNLIVTGNNTSGQTSSLTYDSGIASASNTNISIVGAKVKNGAGFQQSGIASIGDTGFFAVDNDLTGSNVVGAAKDIYTYLSTSAISQCNRFTGATTNCSSYSSTGGFAALLGSQITAGETGSNGGLVALAYIGSGSGSYGLLSAGDTSAYRPIVLGANASNHIGYGGNLAPAYSLCGPSNTLCFDLYGIAHQAGTAPVASTGTITGTDAGGYVSGLSAATSLTVTFANSGWGVWASCTANASVSLATPIYISAQSKTAVTFAFPSLTGTLYYHCVGN